MERWLLWGLLLVVVPVQAQEHQRIQAAPGTSQTWEAAVDATLAPAGSAWWSSSVAVRAGWLWSRLWSVRVGQVYQWQAVPEDRAVLATWGAASALLGRTGESSWGRWNVGAGMNWWWSVPTERDSPRISLELGLQTVADPVILGVLLAATLPQAESHGGLQASLSFQEVINDTTSWTIVATPQVEWFHGLPFWSLSVSWSVGWFRNQQGVTVGLASATEQPWSTTLSAEQTWDG